MSTPEAPNFTELPWGEAPTGPVNVVALPSRASVYADAPAVIRALAPADPVYLFCASRLVRTVRRFCRGFPGTVAYAVGANPHPLVLQGLRAAGIEVFAVGSLGEIALMRNLSPRAALHFDNPIKSEVEIAGAHDRHLVRSFALDGLAELDKLAAAVRVPGTVELSVHFDLGRDEAAWDLATKWGASPGCAAEILRACARLGFRPALSCRPGARKADPARFARHVEVAADIARAAGVTPRRLCVGGGFPVPYAHAGGPDPRQLLERCFRAIGDAVERSFPHRRPLLACAPGRSLVAACASLLCQVRHRRDDGCLFLNDGVFGGLAGQLRVPRALPVRVWRGDAALEGKARPFTVFGPTCDPADRLPRLVPLPETIRPGDWIEFALLGAYGSATATRFNGYCSERYVAVERGF